MFLFCWIWESNSYTHIIFLYFTWNLSIIPNIKYWSHSLETKNYSRSEIFWKLCEYCKRLTSKFITLDFALIRIRNIVNIRTKIVWRKHYKSLIDIQSFRSRMLSRLNRRADKFQLALLEPWGSSSLAMKNLRFNWKNMKSALNENN